MDGYERLEDIRGISILHVNNPEDCERFVVERQVPGEAMAMTIDRVRCVDCAWCSVRPVDAITIRRRN